MYHTRLRLSLRDPQDTVGLTPHRCKCDPLVERELGSRVDREVKINLVTQLSMRVQVPPSRCRSDSVSPRPATGSQRSEAGINGGPWKPHSGYPV